MSAEELLGAIRRRCLQCCGGSRNEVRGCRVRDCALWAYRTPEARAAKGKRAREGAQIDIMELMGDDGHDTDIETGAEAVS